MFQTASKRALPLNGAFELSPLCNMSCDMCYVRLSTREVSSNGGVRTVDEWLEIAAQIREAGTLFLRLTGGEPLLYPDFKKLYLELKQMGMILTVNTNGTLIDEKWADFFGNNKPRRINVTLYGADDLSYQQLCHHPNGYQKTVRGIDFLLQHIVDVKLNFTLTEKNEKDIETLHRFALEKGLPYTIDPYVMPATRERKTSFDRQCRVSPEKAAQIDFFVQKLRRGDSMMQYCEESLQKADEATSYYDEHPEAHIPGPMECLAGKCSFTVNWQGFLRPCVMLPSPSINVFETGFQEAWRKITEGVNSITLHKDCAVCSRKHLCMTCAAAAFYETGDHAGMPDYLCRFAEERERLMREFVKGQTLISP